VCGCSVAGSNDGLCSLSERTVTSGVELGVLKTKAPSIYKNLFQDLSRYTLDFSMCCYLPYKSFAP
jgi:hypothetical protein